MNLTEQQNHIITKLKAHLFHGEFDCVDAVLSQYDSTACDPGRRSLFRKVMGNPMGLFAFQSLSHAQDDIMRLVAQRHSKVLSLWALPDQLNLLHQEVDVVSSHLLDVLKIEQSMLAQESRQNALMLVSKLLQHDNFECVTRLCGDLGVSLYEPLINGFLFYKTKGSRGTFEVNYRGALEVNFAKPYPLFATALFNLTIPKVDYLATQNIVLDDLDENASIFQENTDYISHLAGPQLEQSKSLLSRLMLERHVNKDAPARPSRVM